MSKKYNEIFDIAAEEGVKNLLKSEGVAYRNEFRYRLESPAPYSNLVPRLLHNVIDRAITRLEESGDIITTNLRGRRRKSSGLKPLLFYRLKDSSYSKSLQALIKKKRDLSNFITGISSYAGFYAQKLWVEAMSNREIKILDEDTSEFGDYEAKSNGDIDVIIEYEGFTFGVEIKNKFSYPTDTIKKFTIAAQLDVIPLFIARTLSYGHRRFVTGNGGIIKIYETAIFPNICVNMMSECIECFNFPMLILEKIDEHVMNNLIETLDFAISEYDERLERTKRYLKR